MMLLHEQVSLKDLKINKFTHVKYFLNIPYHISRIFDDVNKYFKHGLNVKD